MRLPMALPLVLALAWIAAPGPALAAPEAAAATPAQEIRIDNFSFVPSTLKIAAGTKVTWRNADDVPHLVVTNDKTVKSPPLDTDETFSHTFEKPGTYAYFCSLHPMMTGTIVVE